MHGGLWSRLWRHDRSALATIAIGSAIATILWRGITRPMADTTGYRAAADLLTKGWPTLPGRTPGYPLLLLATGSSHRSTHLLFAVQLAMHAVSICLVVDLAHRFGVGRRGRIALAVLLLSPAVMLRVVYEGTECLSALLLTLIFWLLVTPSPPDRRVRRALVIGSLAGVAALVRPTFALLFVPLAALVALEVGRRVPDRPRRWSTAVAATLPALVLVGGLSAYNGIRFDSPGLTPLTPYHLSSRTSPYVENLPRSYEPARSVLIRARDDALLRGESSAPANFIWRARPELSRVTGKQGPALDRYVMELDLTLIVNNPFSYLATVETAAVNYSNLDSQPAILGLGRPAAWVQQALHLVLLALFVASMALVPGLALAGLVPRATLRLFATGLVFVLYTFAVSVMVESGTARLRAPSEPILALLFVLAVSTARTAVRSRAST